MIPNKKEDILKSGHKHPLAYPAIAGLCLARIKVTNCRERQMLIRYLEACHTMQLCSLQLVVDFMHKQSSSAKDGPGMALHACMYALVGFCK